MQNVSGCCQDLMNLEICIIRNDQCERKGGRMRRSDCLHDGKMM